MICAHGRHGMTLVELVVVLAILVALAGTALLATEGLVDQGRRDATVRTLEALREAVIGREGLIDANDKPWVRGFVADMGRLPAVSDPAGVDALEELWSPIGLSQFVIDKVPASDENTLDPGVQGGVQVAAGWRGPYVQLPLGLTSVLDGWGSQLIAKNATGAQAAPGESIAQITSLGANGIEGGTGYDADLTVVFQSDVAPFQGPLQHGDVAVRITGLQGGEQIILRLYGPLNGQPSTWLQQPAVVETPGGDGYATFTDVPIGPRVLRVYILNGAPTPVDTEPFDDPAIHGPIVPIMVVAGGLTPVAINLDGNGP